MKFLQTPEMRLHDDRKIEVVLAEFEAGIVDDIAWVKALKSAKGNESYAKALYFDERIKRLEDHWHTQQKRSLDDADFKLAKQLASLSKEMDLVKEEVQEAKNKEYPQEQKDIGLTSKPAYSDTSLPDYKKEREKSDALLGIAFALLAAVAAAITGVGWLVVVMFLVMVFLSVKEMK
jgi:hypothetical protein